MGDVYLSHGICHKGCLTSADADANVLIIEIFSISRSSQFLLSPIPRETRATAITKAASQLGLRSWDEVEALTARVVRLVHTEPAIASANGQLQCTTGHLPAHPAHKLRTFGSGPASWCTEPRVGCSPAVVSTTHGGKRMAAKKKIKKAVKKAVKKATKKKKK